MHLKSVIHVSTYTRELMMLIHCIADVEKDVSMKSLSLKEAQKLLEDMKVDIPLPKAAVTRNKQNLALDMAIKALNCIELFGNSEQFDQPEIILCKYCVHHGYKGHIPYCDIKTYGYGWKDDDFCSDAERRANE